MQLDRYKKGMCLLCERAHTFMVYTSVQGKTAAEGMFHHSRAGFIPTVFDIIPDGRLCVKRDLIFTGPHKIS